MSAIFKIPDKPEFLTKEEVERLTGYKIRRDQLRWLTENEWQFVKNAGGDPIVCRLYMHLKLSGLPASAIIQPHWRPDFSDFS